MTDVREAILAQLEVIIASTEGIAATARNALDVTPKLKRPAAILHDGTTSRVDSAAGERRSRVQRMEITPRIVIMVRVDDDTKTGPLLTLYQNRIVAAVLQDTTLADLCERIRWESASVEEPTPDSKEPRLTLEFAFVYVFNISQISS